ncbi:hypothetical protein AB0J68_15515 [Micromonospora sp. NPDC049580]|uniref:hypothetical protein n=1 Tax=unclassified Micromonospora TaxID=2617518 RepID=UPI0034124094
MANPVILTVDDDPAVSRAVARDIRRHYGDRYRVLRAASGPEALDALREVKLRGEQVEPGNTTFRVLLPITEDVAPTV